MSRLDALATLLATGLYLSYIPVKIFGLFGKAAPKKWTGAGLVGTLEGLALWPLVPRSPRACAAVVAGGIVVACWLCGRAEKALGRRDDPRIILDEVVGYWTSVAFLPRSAGVLAAGLLLFRFFDSVKLPPYRWLESLPGGLGVVADDVGAGVVANVLVRLLIKAGPGWWA